jgi:hypothetical protein
MQNLKIIFLGFLGAFIFHIANNQLAIGNSNQTNKIITAAGFNLVDSSGTLRGQLAIAKEGPPGLWLMDDKGVARAIIGLYQDGSAYYGLQDKNGAMIQLARSVGEDETPLLIFKRKGSDSMIMGLSPADKMPFLMKYESDRKRTHLFGKSDGI